MNRWMHSNGSGAPRFGGRGSRQKRWCGALALLASLACLSPALAQLGVRIQPSRDLYIVHEPVEVVVTIENRAGRDIILEAPGAQDWLTFEVSSREGQPILSAGQGRFAPLFIQAGGRIQRKLNLAALFPLDALGDYQVVASAYFPPTQQYHTSNRAIFTVSDGQVLWSQGMGVPEGLEDAGDFRRYEILRFRTKERTILYLRITQEQTGRVLRTFSLGASIAPQQPKAEFDRAGRLHILHQAAPRLYAHFAVDTKGKVVEKGIYREEDRSRPQLLALADGNIVVRGGVLDAPQAKAASARPERNLTDRPPELRSLR